MTEEPPAKNIFALLNRKAFFLKISERARKLLDDW